MCRKRSARQTSKPMGLISSMLLACSRGVTYTFEDDRLSYGEQRFVTLGLLAGIPVSVVHTETDHEIRIISFRQVTRREASIFFNEIQD